MKEEKFTKIHHEIVDEIGTLFSHFGAGLGIMANVMSWGDTMNSEDTLQNLRDYNEKYIKPLKSENNS